MPFHVQHKYHRNTLIPKVLYLHRWGLSPKRWRFTFGPGERLAWTPN